MATEEAEKQGSLITQIPEYVNGSIQELKKVTYPTRQETMQATLVTLVIIIFVALCLFVLDLVLNRLMFAVLS